MKKTIVIFSVTLLFLLSSFAQTRSTQNQLSAGFGTQSYKGDLGNSWFDFEEEWYGVAFLRYQRSISKSLNIGLTLTTGDFGHCREPEDAPFWEDGTPVLNMRSRMTTSILTVMYKFANGYILNDSSRLSPYVFAGGGITHHKDTWSGTHSRVQEGTYTCVNAGLGIGYRLYKGVSLQYDLGFGYFTNDALDGRSVGGNDQYMQNTFSLSVCF